MIVFGRSKMGFYDFGRGCVSWCIMIVLGLCQRDKDMLMG